uniref:NAC domain-containing protein 94 n=1 Tax=Cajanus cajan TaxID=3821 RepID=A0A151SM71_CAJCA|nr:Putative NAC domain-containing protein 94 [Cajanus cajan]
MELQNHSESIGFRFDPTDDILAGYYLRRILAQSLPNDVIQEYDVFQTQPWGLPGGEKHLNWLKFFFYNIGARVFENPDKRVAGNGQWRIMEKDEDFQLPTKLQWIAKRNILVFWEAKGNRFTETNWMMHEFHLAPKSNPSQVNIIINTIVSTIITIKIVQQLA